MEVLWLMSKAPAPHSCESTEQFFKMSFVSQELTSAEESSAGILNNVLRLSYYRSKSRGALSTNGVTKMARSLLG